MTASSDLPFGSEFSPTILHLPDLLEIAEKCVGDRESFERGGWGNDEVRYGQINVPSRNGHHRMRNRQRMF